MTHKDAIRLPDPTILLTKGEWNKFDEKDIKKNNYKLLHFLNSPMQVAIDTVNTYLKSIGALHIAFVINMQNIKNF